MDIANMRRICFQKLILRVTDDYNNYLKNQLITYSEYFYRRVWRKVTPMFFIPFFSALELN